LLAFYLFAQNSIGQKVGVVLSGGGANGLAHIGVLEALEEGNVPIDYITGTSAGAYIAALYACGYTPEEIKTIVLSEKFQLMTKGELDENGRFLLKEKTPNASMINFNFSKDNLIKSVLPTSFISSELLDYEMFVSMATHSASNQNNFDSLFIPFRCVASDIENKKSFIFKSGNLNEAVRASMTYPFYLSPISVDGVLLFDGGLYNNFPADVLYEEFEVDYIIGSNVSYNADPPKEDDLISQITNMLVTPSDFSLPCKNGIIIEPETGVTTFDFENVKTAIDAGYNLTLKKLDSIRNYVKDSVNPNELNLRRSKYKTKITPLRIKNIIAIDQNLDTIDFVVNSIKGNQSDPYINEEKLRKRYFRTMASPQIKMLYPTLSLNSDSTYTAKMYVKKEKEFELEVGGHFSSRAVNTGFIGLSYNNISKSGLSLNASSYFGKFYGSTKLELLFDIPAHKPIRFAPYFVLNRWDYFRSFATFFEESTPSFLVQNEMYYGASFSYALGNKTNTNLDFRIFDLTDEYYQTDNFTQVDTTDITNFSGQTVSWTIEQNLLNKKQWATQGYSFRLKARYVSGKERSISGSTSDFVYDFRKRHQWINIEASGSYFPVRTKKFKFGFSGKGVFNSQSLFANYTASILSTTAFSPLPDSKTYFLADYRAPQYLGGGTNLIFSFINGLDIRLDPFVFQPFKQIVRNDDGTFGYSELFSKTTFMAAASIIYNTPIGPLRFTANYFPNESKQFNYQLSFGYVLFNERAIR
jgi:NTE family protein